MFIDSLSVSSHLYATWIFLPYASITGFMLCFFLITDGLILSTKLFLK